MRPPRNLVALAAAAIALTACSRSDGAAPVTTLPLPDRPTTTAAPAPTTTTTSEPAPPPLELVVWDAPDDLAAEILKAYSLAVDPGAEAPDAPPGFAEHLRAAEPADPVFIEMSTTTGLVLGSHVAVAAFEDDYLLGVSDDGEDWELVGGRLPSVGVAPWFGDDPWQVFVIGSDARTHEDPLKLRADSLHIVSVSPDGSEISIVGIPRDSWIEAPYGRNDKFTNIMAGRGPESIVEAGETLTGLEFDGHVTTGFAGFVRLVNDLGGMEIDIPFAMNEPKSKAYFDAGLQMIDGFQALAFARNRTLSGGDFTRQFHHGVIMQWGLAEVQDRGIEELPVFLEYLTEHTSTDLEAAELLLIGAATFEHDPFDIPNLVVPGVPGSAGAASVVYLEDGAFEIFEDLSDGVLDDVPAG